MKSAGTFTIILALLLFPAIIFAQDQDITGIWKGDFYIENSKQTLPFEVSISEVNGKLVGYSYITFEEEGKKRVGVMEIKIKQKDDLVIIQDEKYVSDNYEKDPPKNILKTITLTLTKKDTLMTLKGNWTTANSKSRRYQIATGNVRLERKTDFKETALYKELETLKLSENLAFNEPPAKPAPVVVAAAPKPVVEEPKKPEPVIAKVDSPKTEIKPAEQAVAVTEKPKVVEEKKPVTPPSAPAPKPAAVAAAPVVVAKPQPKPEPQAVAAKPEPKPAPQPVAAKPQPKPAAPQPVAAKPQPKPAAVPTPPPVAAKPAPVAPKPAVVAVAAPPVVVKKQETDVVPASIAKQAATNASERKTNTIQTVYYRNDSLELTLYDNGEIDGDTVSVLMNGKVIIAKQGLNTKQNSKVIYIDKETPDSIMLVMYAENLGSIPPNTGLMVVHDGNSVYEVRFSADLKTNAAILLQRRKEE